MNRFIPLSFFASALCLWGSALVAHAEDRALIIGVENYQNPDVRPALGAVRDADDMARFAAQQLKFAPHAIRKLTGAEATLQGITAAVQSWLIAGTKPGDRVLFYYSGHGSILPDNDGDELDDKHDETIVAYDANRQGMGQIRDDQFSRWIADLAGRRIVMIFDSCHSGTISRDAFAATATDATSRYLAPDPSLLTEAPKTRNLLEVSDGLVADTNRISSQSDVVVISAAGAKQLAYGMKENGHYRGGLTASLLLAYGNGTPKLGEMESSIRAQLKKWRLAKQLGGTQIPEFAVSAVRLKAEPLFGTWESVPAIALVNPRSKIKVSLTTNDTSHSRNAQGHLVYYDGDKISYGISTDTAGYLYLLAFSRDPDTKAFYVTMLLPNQHEGMNNEIKPPGLRLPATSDYEITPTGLDMTVALVTTRKLNFAIKDRYSWDELFGLLNLKELQQEVAQRMRGVEVKPAALDWQAASLPIFTTKKN